MELSSFHETWFLIVFMPTICYKYKAKLVLAKFTIRLVVFLNHKEQFGCESFWDLKSATSECLFGTCPCPGLWIDPCSVFRSAS